MTKRDEMLAVIRERDGEVCRHLLLSWRWWNPLAWYHHREAKRLIALNERDLKALPPLRHRQAKVIPFEPKAIGLRRTQSGG